MLFKIGVLCFEVGDDFRIVPLTEPEIRVNAGLAERLREATHEDSTLNAVVLLDVFAKTLPMVIEESLEELRHLFAPSYLPAEPPAD